MPSQIRPNRLEVNDRFPMLGFTIRTDGSPQRAEVAVAADPSLFSMEHKAERTPGNFYSSRAGGPLMVPRGEAVYIVPPQVLARFIGNERLYFALATTPDRTGATTRIDSLPGEGSPYISLRGLTGRSMKRVRLVPSRQERMAGYGQDPGAGLEWAGDIAVPGSEAAAKGGAAKAATPPAADKAAPPEGTKPSADPAADYDDGFGPLPSSNAPDKEKGATAQSLAFSSEDAERGIDGPIPDDDSAAAQSLGYSRGMDQEPEYPGASRFVPAAPGNYRAMSTERAINRVVIHITDGRANINGPVSWFRNPAARVSAHYIVGQDGEIVQMVRHNDIAWHAHTANSDSIGIEHVANTRGLNPTEAQYQASAALVRWLCNNYGIPMDRDHILGHSEADPGTTHTACPNSVWDWDRYMALVASAAQAQSLGARSSRARTLGGESFSINWDEIEPVPQPTDVSCWAASAAMVVGWNELICLSPETIAQIANRTTATGLDPAQVEQFANEMGLTFEQPQCYTIEGFRSLLETKGPLWVAADVPGLHAIVVTGMYQDGDNAFVRITDPWDRQVGTPGAPGPYLNTHATGSRYIMRWEDFVQEYERAATDYSSVNLQILHSGGIGNHVPNYGRPAGYAQSLAARTSRARAMGGQSFSINWDEIEPVPQPTDISCWAASASMVVGWNEQICLSPETIAQIANRTTATGLDPAQVEQFANEIGLTFEQPQCYTIEGFRNLLETKGPLWVGAAVPSLHVIVVTGMYQDGDNAFVRITDPWDRQVGTPGAPGPYLNTHATGSRYIMRWEDFVQEYERAATDYSSVNLQILHSGGIGNHIPNYGQPAGYAQSLAARTGRARAMGGQSFSINWDDIEPVPQPTDISCWAASAAMVVGWNELICLSPETIAQIANRTTATGLDPTQVEQFANEIGLTFEQPQCYTIEGFRNLLETRGPLWVGAAVPSLHVIVVTGMYQDGDNAFVRITDPWDRQVGTPGAPGPYLNTHATGSRYIMRWEDFVQEYERAATDYSSVNLQILHSGGIGDHVANYGKPAGYAQSLGRLAASANVRPMAAQSGRVRLASPPPPRSRAMGAGADAAIAIGGVILDRVVNNEGDVSWELDQFRGIKHPNDQAPSAPARFSDASTIRLEGWPKAGGVVDEISADFTVDWQYNGLSLGNVRIENARVNDAVGWGLRVQARIMDDAIIYPPSNCAALRVRFHYRFTRSIGSDVIAITELHLYGDGTYEQTGRWEQAETLGYTAARA